MVDFLIRRSLLLMPAALIGCGVQPLSPVRALSSACRDDGQTVKHPDAGQVWVYKKFNVYNSNLLDVVTERVVETGEQVSISRLSQAGDLLTDEIHHPWGWIKQDSYWDALQTYVTPIPLWPQALSPGTKLSFGTYYLSRTSSFKYWLSGQMEVVGCERVRLGSRSYDTIRVEKITRQSHFEIRRSDTMRHDILWLSPELGRWVIRETKGEFRTQGGKGSNLFNEDWLRYELQS